MFSNSLTVLKVTLSTLFVKFFVNERLLQSNVAHDKFVSGCDSGIIKCSL